MQCMGNCGKTEATRVPLTQGPPAGSSLQYCGAVRSNSCREGGALAKRWVTQTLRSQRRGGSAMATRCCGVCILLGLMLCHAPASWGADGIAEQIKPSGWFLQAGVGDAKTDAYVIGAKWDWRWVHPLSWGVVTGYFDADAGRWSTRHAGISSFAWATQVGGAPIFRLEQTPGLDRWFGEIGI